MYSLVNRLFSISNHILDPARQVQSPNQSDRKRDCRIELLVIHNISLPPGEFGGSYIDDLFCNRLNSADHPFFEEICHLTVSSHLLIDREGVVTQYVPFNMKAWHAGESLFEGRTNCNEFSIGIELEGSDDENFSDAQYNSLIAVSNTLMSEYPGITTKRLVGHSDIAPGRKTDPGPCFDWQRLHEGIVHTDNQE